MDRDIKYDAVDAMRDTLFDLREWLQWKLNTSAAHVSGEHSPSGHPHGWCAIQIPDWDVKQKIAAINELLGAK